MSSTFSQLHRIVQQQTDHAEYWSEFGREACVPLAGAMQESDWAEVRRRWATESEVWKVRMANFAATCPPQQGIPFLLETLPDSRGDVFVRVTESLGEFSLEDVKRFLSAEALIRMEEIGGALKGLDRIVVDHVMRRLRD